MSRWLVEQLRASTLPRSKMAVAVVMAEPVNEDLVNWRGCAVQAAEAGYHPRAFDKIRKQLVADGILEQVDRGQRGQNASYRFHPEKIQARQVLLFEKGTQFASQSPGERDAIHAGKGRPQASPIEVTGVARARGPLAISRARPQTNLPSRSGASPQGPAGAGGLAVAGKSKPLGKTFPGRENETEPLFRDWPEREQFLAEVRQQILRK